MAVEEYIRCGKCAGTGVVDKVGGGKITCPICMGSGKKKNPAYRPSMPTKNPFR